MNGHYIRSTDRQVISEEDKVFDHLGEIWKKDWGETIAAQDHALQTKHHATKILQREKDSKCRLSKQFGETHHISMPNSGKITIHKAAMIECVLNCNMQWNSGRIRQVRLWCIRSISWCSLRRRRIRRRRRRRTLV